VSRRTRSGCGRTPDACLTGKVVGGGAEAPKQIVELPHPLRDEVVGPAAGVVEDPVTFRLGLAPDELGLALCVAQHAGRLGLGGTYDRLDALRGVSGETSKAETVHAPTVSPLGSREYRTFV
jgi:hypothetical protein